MTDEQARELGLRERAETMPTEAVTITEAWVAALEGAP